MTLKRVIIYFPIGNYFELEVAIRKGNVNVVPSVGTIRGDNVIYDISCAVVYGSQEPVILYWKNNNPAEVRECYVLVEGDEW